MKSLLGCPEMGGLAFSSAAVGTSTAFSGNPLLFPSFLSGIRIRWKADDFYSKKVKFSVFASKKEEPKLNEWDLMELKFGRLLGEDPKLTIAKIMARKIDPDASYMEVEKSFYKNKGKIAEIEEIPLDWSDKKKPSSSLDGLNLVKPIPNKAVQFKTNDKPAKPEIERPTLPLKKPFDGATKARLPNVILRKPRSFYEDGAEDKTSRLRLKPNLSLKMRNEQSKDKFSDITLLRKPEPINPNTDPAEKEATSSDNHEDGITFGSSGLRVEQEEGEDGGYEDFTLVKKPEVKTKPEEKQEEAGVIEDEIREPVTDATTGATEKESVVEMQRLNQIPSRYSNNKAAIGDMTDETPANFGFQVAAEAILKGKPERLDQSMTEASMPSRGREYEGLLMNKTSMELKDPPSISSLEESHWNKAESLFKTETRADVELISSSTRGFAVSFGSLVGFLPYRNLAAKWKFLAFESWLRLKGVDPSMYRQNLGVIGSQNFGNLNTSLDSSLDSEVDKRTEGEISSDMRLEDLLMIYDQEKLKFLSSFVGQKIKVNVSMADRNSGKLVFSMRPREKEEAVEKKRSLMAKLRVGDVVKCCIKKITYFGIFVEVEGVPALIHQTEVSWDATLDPASYFKIGQIVDAKVHQLDFALERIFLSLKEITPDPLTEALESVVSDHDSLGGKLQAAEADAEWAEVESLIKELEQIEGIQLVSKGRFFLSPGLAPTFQVYMASMYENQYKLLARSGNRVQELIVEASLNKEEMKSAIMSCTNRVL